jgi:hypothetical protein
MIPEYICSVLQATNETRGAVDRRRKQTNKQQKETLQGEQSSSQDIFRRRKRKDSRIAYQKHFSGSCKEATSEERIKLPARRSKPQKKHPSKPRDRKRSSEMKKLLLLVVECLP